MPLERGQDHQFQFGDVDVGEVNVGEVGELGLVESPAAPADSNPS
jgi:hypothetical protein